MQVCAGDKGAADFIDIIPGVSAADKDSLQQKSPVGYPPEDYALTKKQSLLED